MADADADGGDTDTAAAALQLVREVADYASAGCAERVSEGDGTAVHIHSVGIQLRPESYAGQRLNGEGLVEFEDVDVAPRPAGIR